MAGWHHLCNEHAFVQTYGDGEGHRLVIYIVIARTGKLGVGLLLLE